MSIKILTKKAVDNTNIDGARQNHFNAGMRSGIVKGALSECNVYASSTNVLIVGSGELRLSGHQIVIEDYESFTISNRPTSPVRYSIIAEINVVEENPEFNMFIQSSDVALVQQNLYSTINGDGKFQLELARFTIDTNGYITDITRTADLITGASENGYDYINIGEVTTTMLATGVNAEVNVENVTDEQTGEKKTNFSFGLPQTAGTIIEVGGEPVSNIGFTEDPQSQLDELKKGTALPVGSTFYSSVILDDPAFHLLDGSSLLNTGIYEEFYTWIKGRLASDPSAVPTCTIEQYASDMATYGQCGKFVVNDTASDLTSGGFSVLANSVKLPTITEFIASNNGGKEIGSAQLDMFKSHSHYTNTAYGTAESGGGNAIVYHTTGGYLSSETGGEETRPKNIRYPFYIVVATATKTDVQINLDNVATDINALNNYATKLENKISWKTILADESVIIPMKWEDVTEFCFQVLGDDQSTFGYLYILRSQWHNEGTYPVLVNCINQNGEFIGSNVLSVSNKTESSFQINGSPQGTLLRILVGYR